MALTISDFKTAAARGDKTIIEARPQGTVTSTGFFGRVFGSAGKDRATNQATMQTFLGTIVQEYGASMRGHAQSLLARLVPEGHHLSGRVVKQVLQRIELTRQQVTQHNWALFNKLLYDTGPHGLVAMANRHASATTTFSPRDLEGVARQVRALVEWESAADSALTGDDIEQMIQQDFGEQLGRSTFASLALLDQLESDPARFGLAGLGRKELQNLRSVLVANGVIGLENLQRVLLLARAISALLPALARCRNGPELMLLLGELRHAYQALPDGGWAPTGMTEKAYLMQAATQAAIAMAGLADDAVRALLADVMGGTPGVTVARTCGSLATERDSPLHGPMLMFFGVFHDLKESLGSYIGTGRNPNQVPESDTTRFSSYSHPREIPKDMMLCLRCLGLPVDRRQYETGRQTLAPTLDRCLSAGQPPQDIWRLVQSAGSVTGLDGDLGLAAMRNALERLKAAQPGMAAFTPECVWNCLFQAPLPQGVSAGTLALAVGREINARLEERLEGSGVVLGQAQVELGMALLECGLDWEQGARLAARPGPVRFEHLASPLRFVLTGPPSEALERQSLEDVIRDVHRQTRPVSISMEGHAPIALYRPVPGQEERDRATRDMDEAAQAAYHRQVAELEDYHAEGTRNPVARDIQAQAGALCPTQAQRTGLLRALSQISAQPLGRLAPFAFGFDVSAQAGGRWPVDIQVSRRGSDIIVRLETPPDLPRYGMATYSVDAQGAVTMTDLLVRDNTLEAAKRAIRRGTLFADVARENGVVLDPDEALARFDAGYLRRSARQYGTEGLHEALIQDMSATVKRTTSQRILQERITAAVTAILENFPGADGKAFAREVSDAAQGFRADRPGPLNRERAEAIVADAIEKVRKRKEAALSAAEGLPDAAAWRDLIISFKGLSSRESVYAVEAAAREGAQLLDLVTGSPGPDASGLARALCAFELTSRNGVYAAARAAGKRGIEESDLSDFADIACTLAIIRRAPPLAEQECAALLQALRAIDPAELKTALDTEFDWLSSEDKLGADFDPDLANSRAAVCLFSMLRGLPSALPEARRGALSKEVEQVIRPISQQV